MPRIKQKHWLFLVAICLFWPSISAISQEGIPILPYFENTGAKGTNQMSSGEVFWYVEMEGQEFKLCKNIGCSNYQLFRYDDEFIYHVEDTSWATGINQNIKCEDTGNDAFYNVYNVPDITCENYNPDTAGGIWTPRTMLVGESHSEMFSIVAFDKITGQCCRSRYAGNLPHKTTLTYHGTIQLPTGPIIENAIILTVGLADSYKENFYFGPNRGWVGWDQGSAESGSYITNWDEEPGEIPEGPIWNIPYLPGYNPERAGLTFRPSDPAHLYINIEANKDEFFTARDSLKDIPPLRPMTGILPNAGWVPDGQLPNAPKDIETDPINAAIVASEATKVRASLILALLSSESGYNPFAGTSHFCEALCSSILCEDCPDCCECASVGNSYCTYSNSLQCSNFTSIWNEVGYIYEQYEPAISKETINLSSAGPYTAGGETRTHCGGAMGAAQAMPSSWNEMKSDVSAIMGYSPISPWRLQDAFAFSGTFLANWYNAVGADGTTAECVASGGAVSGTCFGEACSVHRYMGAHSEYAKELVALANAIADEYDLGEEHCKGWGEPDPPTPESDWRLPIHGPTILSSDAPDHIERGSVNAWDFTASFGENVYPIADGFVNYAYCHSSFDRYGNKLSGYGCWVGIDHGNGYESRYVHLNEIDDGIYLGKPVTQETVLGYVGCTGYTEFGPHLHLEIRHNGVPIDPAQEQIFGNPASIGLRYDEHCHINGCPNENCNPCPGSYIGCEGTSKTNICKEGVDPLNTCLSESDIPSQ